MNRIVRENLWWVSFGQRPEGGGMAAVELPGDVFQEEKTQVCKP